MLDTAEALRSAELLLCLPEHQVHLEGGGHPSQNDLWALLRTASGTASLSVEAKAGEPLDELVRDWLPKDDQRSRKLHRLKALKATLGIEAEDVSPIRYQLLHRAASALLEAERFRAQVAVLLVHSFNRSADDESWQDFRRFTELMGAAAVEGVLVRTTTSTSVPLYVGWVSSVAAGEALLGAAV